MNSIKELPPNFMVLNEDGTEIVVNALLTKDVIEEYRRRGYELRDYAKVILCMPTAENIEFFKKNI